MFDAVVPVLIGEGETQEVEDIVVDLRPDAILIKDIHFDVIIDRCRVIFDKVLIVGRVIVNIQFKTDGDLGDEDITEIRVVCGDVRHCTAIVPFSASIEIPGARPGDICRVVCAEVEGAVSDLIDRKKKRRKRDDCDDDVLGDDRKRDIDEIDKIRVTFAIVIQVQVLRKEDVRVQGNVRQLQTGFTFPRH